MTFWNILFFISLRKYDLTFPFRQFAWNSKPLFSYLSPSETISMTYQIIFSWRKNEISSICSLNVSHTLAAIDVEWELQPTTVSYEKKKHLSFLCLLPPPCPPTLPPSPPERYLFTDGWRESIYQLMIWAGWAQTYNLQHFRQML